jgi:hypothetical protein
LTGRDRAQSEVFRIAIHRLAHAADPDLDREVFAAAAVAVRVLRRDEDRIWRARLRYNRGILLWERGEARAAATDLRAAFALYQGLGADAAAIDAAAALAGVSLMEGDVVGCLAMVDRIRATVPSGHLCFALDEVHASALTQARLLPEAGELMASCLEVCIRAGRTDFATLAKLDVAAIAILSGDSATALQMAGQAARSFAARGQQVAAARASVLRLHAQLLSGSLTKSSTRSGLKAALVLDTAGWRREALRTRLLTARVALAVNASALSHSQLRLAKPLRTHGTVADKVSFCHAQALSSLKEQDVAAAVRHLRTGLALLEDFRAAFGAAELKAAASAIGSDLSQVGLRIAVDQGNPVMILSWAERLRGNALRLPLVRPPADRQLRARQTELRRVATRIREAEARADVTRGLASRQVELEAAISARTRLVRGEGGSSGPIPTPQEAARVLGDRVLVEYVELDGVLRALTLERGRLLLHELGELDTAAELAWVRFALGQLARGGNSPAQRAALLANARAAAGALDRMLIEPLLPVLGDAPLVVVPTGPLHTLPWGSLPSLYGRPVVVAPSLSFWHKLSTRPRSRRRKVTLIAGPRLRHAAAEVRDVSGLPPSAIVLYGKDATVRAARAALDGAALAHVACHGRFRADSPLFSSLELADGALTVHELQLLRRAPELLVLSSCDLALSERHPGDELLGLAAALLAMGTKTIVASVVPVPDAAARRLMLAFHRQLLAGTPPATALARAQAGLRGRSAALAGFVCLGTG